MRSTLGRGKDGIQPDALIQGRHFESFGHRHLSLAFVASNSHLLPHLLTDVGTLFWGSKGTTLVLEGEGAKLTTARAGRSVEGAQLFLVRREKLCSKRD